MTTEEKMKRTLPEEFEFDPNFRYFGTVKWFNRLKGYGFIVTEELDPDANEIDVMVHYTGIISEFEYKTLVEGENVYFNIKRDEKHGIIAYNVSKKEELA